MRRLECGKEGGGVRRVDMWGGWSVGRRVEVWEGGGVWEGGWRCEEGGVWEGGWSVGRRVECGKEGGGVGRVECGKGGGVGRVEGWGGWRCGEGGGVGRVEVWGGWRCGEGGGVGRVEVWGGWSVGRRVEVWGGGWSMGRRVDAWNETVIYMYTLAHVTPHTVSFHNVHSTVVDSCMKTNRKARSRCTTDHLMIHTCTLHIL